MIARLMSGPLVAARETVSLLGWPARVESILSRTEAVLSRIEDIVTEVEGVAASAAATASQSEAVAERAAETAARAEGAVNRGERLLETYGDSLAELAPLARAAAAGLTPDHMQSLTRALDQLPEVVDLIAPAMRGLAILAPELDELMDRLNAVGEIVEGLPGASLLRRRGQSAEDGGDMEP